MESGLLTGYRDNVLEKLLIPFTYCTKMNTEVFFL